MQYATFTRESHYKLSFPNDPDLANLSIAELRKQTNPELKVYLSYFAGR